jgi:hypothetical protein
LIYRQSRLPAGKRLIALYLKPGAGLSLPTTQRQRKKASLQADEARADIALFHDS